MMVAPRFRFYGGWKVYGEFLSSFFRRAICRGDDVQTLQKQVAARLGVPHAIATPQGRVALYLLIKHTIKPGQTVVMSPYTIFDVINMVVCAGGVPKFADIRKDTCNLDPKALEVAIDEKTGAVIVTHLHGLVSDVQDIRHICERQGIPLIEDVAQAFGAKFEETHAGAFGVSAALSFGRAKNVNSLFGGMVVTKDERVAQAIESEMESWPYEGEGRLIKRALSCGLLDVLTWPLLFNIFTFWVFRFASLNNVSSVNKVMQTENNPYLREAFPDNFRRRFTPMQARIVLKQLGGLDRHSEERASIAGIYREGLKDVSGVDMLADDDTTTNIHLVFPIVVKDRDRFVKHMMKNFCDVSVQHIHNTADLDCFAPFASDCPNAREVSRSLVLLPTYPGYSRAQAQRNVDVIKKYFDIEEESPSLSATENYQNVS